MFGFWTEKSLSFYILQMTIKGQNDLAFSPKIFPKICPKAERPKSEQKRPGFQTDFDNRTSGNGTEVICPKTKLVPISDVDLTVFTLDHAAKQVYPQSYDLQKMGA